MLDQAVKKKKLHSPTILAELRDHLIMEWHKLDANVIMSHIDCMPKRIQAVIKAGGNIIPSI